MAVVAAMSLVFARAAEFRSAATRCIGVCNRTELAFTGAKSFIGMRSPCLPRRTESIPGGNDSRFAQSYAEAVLVYLSIISYIRRIGLYGFSVVVRSGEAVFLREAVDYRMIFEFRDLIQKFLLGCECNDDFQKIA